MSRGEGEVGQREAVQVVEGEAGAEGGEIAGRPGGVDWEAGSRKGAVSEDGGGGAEAGSAEAQVADCC